MQTRTLYKSVYLNLVTVVHWPTPGVNKGFNKSLKDALFANEGGMEGWLHDRVLPYLATSRDGKRFNYQWVDAKQPLLHGNPSHPEPIGVVLPAAQIVTHRGMHWLYYAGTNKAHTERWTGECKIYLARWQQNRISGLQPCKGIGCSRATHADGVVTTKPFRWPQGALSLVVNVDFPQQRRDGRASVELVSTNGTVMHRLLEVSRDSDREARVEHLKLHELGDMQLRFALHGTVRLYAFTVACGPCGCDGHPTDITCDKGNSFSKGLSGFDFVGQKIRAEVATRRMIGAIKTLSDVEHLGRPIQINSLLEYGCATGITTRAVKQALPHAQSAIGFDVDQAALAKARANAGDSGTEFIHASKLGARTADLVVCLHVITVQTADELAAKAHALAQFVSPGGFLWIIFKKEAYKHAVDEYVKSLPNNEYIYILNNVAETAERSLARTTQRDAFLYLLVTRRAAIARSIGVVAGTAPAPELQQKPTLTVCSMPENASRAACHTLESDRRRFDSEMRVNGAARGRGKGGRKSVKS